MGINWVFGFKFHMVDKEDKSSGLDHQEISKIQDELIPYSFQNTYAKEHTIIISN